MKKVKEKITKKPQVKIKTRGQSPFLAKRPTQVKVSKPPRVVENIFEGIPEQFQHTLKPPGK